MEQVNDQKVTFIICSNDARELDECIYYLNRLNVPKGIEADIVVIDDAISMASGYNRGMQLSDAKYKVYLHHDTMILNRFFIEDMITIFQKNSSIGIMGVIGTDTHDRHGLYFNCWNIGATYVDCIPHLVGREDVSAGEVHKALAVDGLILMTQEDILWREDLFQEWDFYDVSQCFEFLRAGYEVAVPYQQQAWCWHDTETSKLGDYNKNCLIMKQNYQDIFEFDMESSYSYNQELADTLEALETMIREMINNGEKEQVYTILKEYYKMITSNRHLILLSNIAGINHVETDEQVEKVFWKLGMTVEELEEQLIQMKFAVTRVNYIDDISLMEELVKQECYSPVAWISICVVYAVDRKKVLEVLGKLYQKYGFQKDYEYIKIYLETH